jgi:hypothetical protein
MLTTGKLGRVGELIGALDAGRLVQDLEDRFAAHIGEAMRGGTSDLDVAELRIPADGREVRPRPG